VYVCSIPSRGSGHDTFVRLNITTTTTTTTTTSTTTTTTTTTTTDSGY
jgi:hypothetical protein